MRLTLSLLLLSAIAGAGEFDTTGAPMVKRYCAGCHSGAKAAANVDLSKFPSEAAVRKDLALWFKATDLIRAGQMPPAGMPKPSDADREKLVGLLEEIIEKMPDGKPADPGRPVLRRLTRLEFNNTVRDLLGLSTDLFMFPERLPFTKSYFQPWLGQMGRTVDVDAIEYGNKVPVLLRFAGLPGENRAEHGFSNRADALNVTPLLMEKYLEVATEIASHPELRQRSSAFRLLTAPTEAGAGALPDTIRQRLSDFLLRAFRRPPTAAEVDRYARPALTALSKGENLDRAMRASLRAVMTSPALIHRIEAPRPVAGEHRELDDYELASRLSYFLWASMPDAELLALAKQKSLRNPETLEEQALRMLRDPRARELSDSFAFQWMQLNKLFGAQPDLDKFRHYYQYDAFGTNKGNLGMDMVTEALLLFETVMTENRSVLDFIDPKFGWLNSRLMKHYALADRYAKQFKEGEKLGSRKWYRVEMADRNRGGILTMGAPLTMTSTPLRTSPVIRGAWILETIFNRPPPPPPNVNVGTIEEAGGETAQMTVRQKVELHRKNPACASCHQRMDPPGFALENFDPVGAWREQDNGLKVDAAGALSHGRAFDGPAQFKDALLARRDEFAQGFVEHLMGWALGRRLEWYDAPAVKQVVRDAAADQYRFSRIVAGIVRSRPFRYTRNEVNP